MFHLNHKILALLSNRVKTVFLNALNFQTFLLIYVTSQATWVSLQQFGRCIVEQLIVDRSCYTLHGSQDAFVWKSPVCLHANPNPSEE